MPGQPPLIPCEWDCGIPASFGVGCPRPVWLCRWHLDGLRWIIEHARVV